MIRFATFVSVACSFAVVAAGCGSSGAPASAQGDAGSDDASIDDASRADAAIADTSPVDAAPDVDKSATCAATFGMALTDSFGRFDGTVVAVVPPDDQSCAAPNKTHMILQVMMNGAVYRMVVDVLSTGASPDVLFDEIDAPLPGGAWSEGWHTDAMLDYPTTLNVHSTSFVAMKQADLVAKLTGEIDLGAHVSVFSTSQGEHDSTHLVHRWTTPNGDGAIVIRPESSNPHWLLMTFSEYTF